MVTELSAAALRQAVEPPDLGFTTTAELAELPGILGQPRAVGAIEFSLAIDRPGYNLFVLGPPGTGRHAILRGFLERKAAERPAPSDWVYVANFRDENRPRALPLPPGRGAKLQAEMAELVEGLRTAFASAFEGEDYQAQRKAIDRELSERQEAAFRELGERAAQAGLLMARTPVGVVFAPNRGEEVLSPQEFEQLAQEERERLQREVVALQEALEKKLRQLPRWRREARERVRSLDLEVARRAASGLIEELQVAFADLPDIVAWLDEVEHDVVANARLFLAADGARAAEEPTAAGVAAAPLRRYRVNLLVDGSTRQGAPVVVERQPTLQNLVGRVEHVAQMGVLSTDFTLIKPGALHHANGGYLLVDALHLLRQPLAWETLQRMLQQGEIRIESPAQVLGLVSTVTLEPEPIPLALKVVLIGEPFLYDLLTALDPEFLEMFKVAAEFDDVVDRAPATDQDYARLLATFARAEGLRPFDRGAVARLFEAASRRAGDVGKLSLEARHLFDLLREANHHCGNAGRDVVNAADVEAAVEADTRRADLWRQRRFEQYDHGTLLTATHGAVVGQVNALSVGERGGFAFGFPSRVTARARIGEGRVLDIEREVDLSGPIHSKGVLILGSFLGDRFARESPLSLSASLVFEQSYGGIEGDSASLAELCALLSAISEVPLRQTLAVTGSVDQHGAVQAVGGVNEKIEGFFELCRRRGLSGDQGVLLPASNVRHLILRREVLDAVEAGRFHLYPVAEVDQALELLTGLPAGVRGEDGDYPEGSFNHAVESRLAEFALRRQAFARVFEGVEEPAAQD